MTRRLGTASLLALSALVAACGSEPQETMYAEPMPAPPIIGIDETRVIDLTHPFDADAIYWPTAQPFELTVDAHGYSEDSTWYASNQFRASEHGGTHMDAPIHFAAEGLTNEAIPLEQLMGPAVVIDVSDFCEKDPDYQLQVKDIEGWESMYGQIPEGAIVFMRTGWHRKWGDREAYFGSATWQDPTTLHFPGFSEEVARFLTEERSIDAVGLDTPSIDSGASTGFLAHRVFAGANMPGFENVAHLNRIPDQGAFIIALPMMITGGTGGPLRIVALVP